MKKIPGPTIIELTVRDLFILCEDPDAVVGTIDLSTLHPGKTFELYGVKVKLRQAHFHERVAALES